MPAKGEKTNLKDLDIDRNYSLIGMHNRAILDVSIREDPFFKVKVMIGFFLGIIFTLIVQIIISAVF